MVDKFPRAFTLQMVDVFPLYLFLIDDLNLVAMVPGVSQTKRISSIVEEIVIACFHINQYD